MADQSAYLGFPPLPVTVLSGFLGSGKTTVLNHLLNHHQGRKIAVIVNDMSEINIDAALVSRSRESLVEMSNGCICCTLREDLLREVASLAWEGRFDYLLIESTGISEPLPVAETFTFRDHQGLSLSDIARLDTCVTVVDGFNFWKDYSGLETLAHRGQGRDRDDERSIVDLLLEQIEFADVILLNKMDLVGTTEQVQLLGLLSRLNPRAKVYPIHFGAIDFDKVVDTQLFDFEVASQDPNWLAVERGQEQSEVDEYGFSSFVYSARRPFHPARFHAWTLEEWPGVVRSKGFFWLASRYNDACYWSQAGAQCRSEPAGLWWAGAPKRVWPTSEAELRKIEDSWLEPHGDRRQELILIGTGLDQQALKRKFDQCLLTPREMELGVEDWKKLEDPFPSWKVTVDA